MLQQGGNGTPIRRALNHAFVSPAGQNTPSNSNTTTPTSSPYYQPFSNPRVGVAGEQRILTPKSVFPLNVQHSEEEPHRPGLPLSPAHIDNIDFNPHMFRARALSVFDEESETECVVDISTQIQTRQQSSSPSHHSPHLSSPHARSRRISNARSSPNIFGSVSKSDVSEEEEEEEDDDIVELMTTSGRFPSSKASTFSRTSPSNSPLLTSRYSPTHYLTGGSSDDESCNVFESARKNRSKRLPFRKRSIPKLVRVDSISSDDGKSPHDIQARPSRKGQLLRLRQYNSLPATPADNSASESLTDLLDTFRKTKTAVVTTPCRTDSSFSDGGGGGDKDVGELASSIVSKFELSDEDGLQVSMELDPHTAGVVAAATPITSSASMGNKDLPLASSVCAGAEAKRADAEATRAEAAALIPPTSTSLHSLFCSIL